MKYNVEGMACAACSARVERAVNKVDGVTMCSVNLLTNSMEVEGSATPDDIVKAVVAAGYGAEPVLEKIADNKTSDNKNSKKKTDLKDMYDEETKKLFKRFILSLGFLLVLMYISMGNMMFGLPLPQFLADNMLIKALSEAILALVVMIINRKFFIVGFKGAMTLAPNMDTLVALGSAASYIWSIYATVRIYIGMNSGNMELVHEYAHDLYYESAAMILTLITVGKTLEAFSKGKTTNALNALMNLTPKIAKIERNGVITEVELDEVKVGDIFHCNPGEAIPCDGVILEGYSSIDESALTGEAVPVDKTAGDPVYAATINRNGHIKGEVKVIGEETVLSKIIKLVNDASAKKAPIAKLADRISLVFVPAVIGIAVITFIIWFLMGEGVVFALERAVSVLVISCPCALGLATPVAIMVGNGVGARLNILFKSGEALTETGKCKTVCLDKTGTITEGNPEVKRIYPAEGVDEKKLVEYAFSLEVLSEHPFAGAIVKCGTSMGIMALKIDEFEALPGFGVTGRYENKKIIAGKRELIEKECVIPESFKEIEEKERILASTLLYFACDSEFLGVISVSDVIREDSKAAISRLKDIGLKVSMITGDNEATARAIAKEVGVDSYNAGVLPEMKESIVESFKNAGAVMMVGDGINDAVALTSADIGVAIGAGTDVAIDSADVVLMKNSLNDVVNAVKLSRKVYINIKENLFWAFIYNIILIPVAAGAFYYSFGLKINPMIGAGAMSLSSFFVVMNALRLNLLKNKLKNN